MRKHNFLQTLLAGLRHTQNTGRGIRYSQVLPEISEPAPDPLEGLSEEERTLIQAMWDMVPKDELEDDITIADARELLTAETEEGHSILGDLVPRFRTELQLTDENLRHVLAHYLLDAMAPEEQLSFVLDALDERYDARRESDYDCEEEDYDYEEEDYPW